VDIAIRVVDDRDSCHDVEQLQQQIWGFDSGEVVPYHQLMTAARWGGTLLVAYDGDKPVGFAYGFGGLDQGRPVLCSHMLGVLPEYRSRQVGYRLKMAQRDLARQAGYHRMVWTFDPLEARNAYLNLHKLGAFVEKYSVNHYGEMRDQLNRGLPSDRLLADWRFGPGDEPRPPMPAGAHAAPVLNPAAVVDGVARPGPLDQSLLGAEPVLRVAVPAHTGHLRRSAPDVAAAWRLSLREALTGAFAAGYRAVDFQPPEAITAAGTGEAPAAAEAAPHAAAVAYYILTRRDTGGGSR